MLIIINDINSIINVIIVIEFMACTNTVQGHKEMWFRQVSHQNESIMNVISIYIYLTTLPCISYITFHSFTLPFHTLVYLTVSITFSVVLGA